MPTGTIYSVQHIIPAPSGLAVDEVVNTFHFRTDTGVDMTTNFGIVDTALETFFNSWGPNLSADFASGTRTIKWYRLSDPKPRVPIHVATYSPSFSSGVGTVAYEQSICMSFHAAIFSGDNPRRRRGRVYLGPLNANYGSLAQPTSAATSAITTRGNTLMTSVKTNTGGAVVWAVYSRVDDDAFEVVGGWADNAWDTQRRRGKAPNARSTW